MIPEKLKQAPPANAMRFTASEPPEVTKGDENGKAVKVHLKARSKMACTHFWWGDFVHVFSTMSMPPRIAIDDSHGQEIGYGRPYLTEYGLEIDATIIPNAENTAHPANRVIYNLSNGIPQQASIDFTGTFDLDFLAENQLAEVNGIQMHGPLTIFRNWSLRACAICKEGVDASSETTLLNQEKAPAARSVREAKFILSDGGDADDKKKKTPESEDNKEPEGDKNQGADKPADKPEGDAAPKPDGDDEDEVKKLKKELDELKQENEELKAKLSAVPQSGATPVNMSESKVLAREELLKQYATLSPTEKTLFWRKHKEQLTAH